MREQYLIDVLNRFDTDEIYARELCDFPTEGELTVHDRAVLEHDKISIRKRIVEEIHLTQKWNHKKESGVPPRFADCSFFNFECRTEIEKSIFQKVCDFVSQEHNEGVLLMTGEKGTGKTHLGTAAVRDTQGRYVSMEDLIYKVESSLNFKSPQTEEEVFTDFSTVKFLVIDEVGQGVGSLEADLRHGIEAAGIDVRDALAAVDEAIDVMEAEGVFVDDLPFR